MSLESFAGFDSGESMSAASLEKLQEKMKRAAAQIKAIKKEEKKQKKKEDELLKILLKFIKHSHKTTLILLISRALEENIPANLILAIILLGNQEIQQALGKYLMLNNGEGDSNEKALVFFQEKDDSLPLKIKIEMDIWIKNILEQAEEKPHMIVTKCYDRKMIKIKSEDHFEDDKYIKEKTVKKSMINLQAYILSEYLSSKGQEEPKEKLKEFSHFILKGILEKLEEQLENQKFLAQ